MKLYIHFGIYKAGSSYLQYVCANSRSYLLQNGIFFPNSKEDQKMLLGEISKGNADGFEVALKSRDRKTLYGILKRWFELAHQKKCDIVLISAEALVHQLALSEPTKLLIDVAKQCGYLEVHLMGFFRDLADHAISTFKHRAKGGMINDFNYWVRNVYETPKLLRDLSQQPGTFVETNWMFRKFQKDGEHLKYVFFKDWLQIDVPEFKGKPAVNESLTLSEIQMMQHLFPIYPMVMDVFVRALKALPKQSKAEDSTLELSYYRDAVSALMHNTEEVRLLNAHLPTDEQLIIGELDEIDIKTKTTIRLSLEQLQTIQNQFFYLHSSLGKMLILRRHIASYLPGTIKRLLINR